VSAVLFFATDDPAHNTTPPEGDLADSGWQWQGTWGDFLGTPVHPKFFLSARHLPGRVGVGDAIRFRGQDYQTVGFDDIPGSDLRLWRICGEFPDPAVVHTNLDSAGRLLVLFGRGTRRGEEVRRTNETEIVRMGWRWGAADGRLRWGLNTIEEVVELEEVGPMLRAAFDAGGPADECHLSSGDSGGAAFIFEGGRWELAGIHYAVDGPYNYLGSGPGFQAALFDQRGLYTLEGTDWTAIPEEEGPRPGNLFTTQIAAHADWILARLAEPLLPEDHPVLQQAPDPTGAYRDLPNAVVDLERRVIQTPRPAGIVFLRLRACQPLQVLEVTVVGGQLELRYGPSP
jgi:hypothetical protein